MFERVRSKFQRHVVREQLPVRSPLPRADLEPSIDGSPAPSIQDGPIAAAREQHSDRQLSVEGLRAAVTVGTNEIRQSSTGLQFELREALMLTDPTGLDRPAANIAAVLLVVLRLDLPTLAAGVGDESRSVLLHILRDDVFSELSAFLAHRPELHRPGRPGEARVRVEAVVEELSALAARQTTSLSRACVDLAQLTARTALMCIELALATSPDEPVEHPVEPLRPLIDVEALHPWVAASAAQWQLKGHHRDAVASAATRVEVELRRKLAASDAMSGKDLASQAFSLDLPAPGKTRLRFYEAEPASHDWTNLHEGAANFGRGCFQRIRNRYTHGSAEPTYAEAADALHALSLLARWIDDAKVEIAGTTD